MAYLNDYLLLYFLWSIGGVSVCGLGLFVMGKTINIKKLIILSMTAAIIIAPIWLSPITNGSKLYLTHFIFILVLYSTKDYNIFICTGAVLAGLSLNIILELFYHVLFNMGFDPSWLIRVVRASPGVLTGTALAVMGQRWLHKKTPLEQFEDLSRIKNEEQVRVLKTVPLSQLYTTFMIIVAISSVHITSNQVHIYSRFIPFILVGSILLSYYLTKKYFYARGRSVSPTDLMDFVITIPIIFIYTIYIGGLTSPWKILFIPLIISNALKKNSAYGIISLLIALSSLKIFGVLAFTNNNHWPLVLDLLYGLIYIFIFCSIRYFIYIENSLTRELENARHHLLTNIAHDLRTPITLIQGYSEVLLNKPDKPLMEKKKYLELILDKCNSLKKLAQDLQELLHLKTYHNSLNLGRVSIISLLNQVHNKYELDINNKGVFFEVQNKKIPPEEIQLEADQARLERVFANLIFNAVNHTPPGGTITISADITPDKKNVLFSVADTGQGIGKDDISNIFERFYRGNSYKSPNKGNGLGLAIAKEIIEHHGGQIWVESEPEKGSTFCFTLPVMAKYKNIKRPLSLNNPRIFNTVPLAQIVFALMVTTALIGSEVSFDVLTLLKSSKLLILTPLLLTLLTGFILYIGKIQRPIPFTWSNLIDIILLAPLIIIILLHTGYSVSPWKMLYVPFVFTNALKPEKLYGLSSIFIAAASLVVLGFIGLSNNISWFIEQDLAYISLFTVIYLLIRHFIAVEATLNQKLANSRKVLLSRITHGLQNPLASIEENIQLMVNKMSKSCHVQKDYLMKVYEEAVILRNLIENLFELVQIEANRVVLQPKTLSVDELIDTISKNIIGAKKKTPELNLVLFGYRPLEKSDKHDLPVKYDSYPLISLDTYRLLKAFYHLLAAISTDLQTSNITIACSIIPGEKKVLFQIKASGCYDKTTSLKEVNNELDVILAEKIIQLHGGLLWQEQVNGEKNGFSFTLPLV
ncbi:ATP-binding protein [Desulfitibacter alkalitolerans]|uniref:ATP-binding protein n=1 Tax=Desulfitibacter alkalitolerans TaxID=264641 RepID=UPI0004880AE7|nr:ATP-binding protein [Desulfitibacter alkalitolerans]